MNKIQIIINCFFEILEKSLVNRETLSFREPWSSAIIISSVSFFLFFSALFLIGNPYLSLSIMFVCFLFLCWNFFRLIQADLSLLDIVALTSIFSFLYYIADGFIIFFCGAIRITIFLLILSFLLIFFYPKRVKYTKISFMCFLVSILLLGLFLGLVKLYFFNAAVFFTSNNTEGYPLLFSEIPSNVYLSLKNCDFLGIEKDALFVLDFSSDGTLSEFTIQLGPDQARDFFQYKCELLILDASWFPFNFTFVFTS